MTDKEYRLQKKRVKKYIDKWFKTMGLGWFRVKFEWIRDRDTNPDCMAKTHSSWQYKTATIEWFLPRLANADEEELEACVVHEFSHVLLSGLAQLMENDTTESNQINEYTTELVASAIIWSREAGGES